MDGSVASRRRAREDLRMKGLIIWAQSDCRSTMGLYDELIKQINVPVAVALWFYRPEGCSSDSRVRIGFSPKEFAHISMVPVGDDYERGLKLLDEHPGWMHVFTVYQGSSVWRKLIVEARRRGEKIFIACESPCNMEKGWRRVAKELYLRNVLRWKVRNVISAAECFVNYSGSDDKYAKIIGWPHSKIIPFGYFPPPIQGARCIKRNRNRPFSILATGALSEYRGADVLVEALRILKARGVEYTATITQRGELLASLKEKTRKYGLPIDFPEFVEMSKLIRLYETCSVYVGSGRREPWGMRLNDALNCGAPLVVSRGMGGVRMIDDYGCGLAFRNGDAVDLADKLERLAKDDAVYASCAERAVDAAGQCQPSNKAKELLEILRRFDI